MNGLPPRIAMTTGRTLVGAIVLSGVVACGGEEAPTGPSQDEEIASDGSLPPVGLVIARDSVDIDADMPFTGTDFVVGRRFTGSLPSDLPATVGKQLVLVVRDLSNPDAVCDPGLLNVSCASMVVIDGLDALGRRPGRLTLSTAAGLRTLFVREDFTLDPEPPGF